MKILENSKKTGLLLGAFLTGTMAFAESSEAAEVVELKRPIYEQMGISSTTLFIIMTVFTFVLLVFLVSIANSTKNVLKYKQDQVKKKGNGGKAAMVILALFASSSTFAADPGASESLIPFPDSVFWAYLFVDIVIIMAIIYLSGIVKGSISDMVELPKLFRWTWLTKRVKNTMTDAVPIEEEASILLDHDYDGIKELDNNLPPWWKYGFYITIAWSVFYIFYYQILEIGNLQEAEYLAEMEEGERQMAEYKAAHPEMITAENVELLEDAATISKGFEIYNKNCMSCHAEAGAGSVGPNLTDNYWLYGNDIKGVFTTISEGAGNGMKAWKNDLSSDKIQAVASYILQLDYIAPPTGKDPQGDEK